MALTLGPLVLDAGIDPSQALVIHHADAREFEQSGLVGLHAASTHTEILESLLRVLGPSTPTRDIAAAESHFKDALDSRRHGPNRN